MTILHISDTHGLHHELHDLPAADVIVHSGDLTMAGTENEVIDFIAWFCVQPHRHKVFIAGNHDDCLFGADISGLPPNCHYLNSNGTTIDGMHFFGVPMFVEDDISGNYQQMIESIPSDTDVMISHQPPFGIMDKSGRLHFGNRTLLGIDEAICPKAHLFGHIHAANGLYTKGSTIFSNAALVDEDYKLNNNPHIIEI